MLIRSPLSRARSVLDNTKITSLSLVILVLLFFLVVVFSDASRLFALLKNPSASASATLPC
jgi:hypothetical protein